MEEPQPIKTGFAKIVKTAVTEKRDGERKNQQKLEQEKERKAIVTFLNEQKESLFDYASICNRLSTPSKAKSGEDDFDFDFEDPDPTTKFQQNLLNTLEEKWHRLDIKLERKNGNLILVASQAAMLLSECLPKVEEHFKSVADIFEVHFIAKEVFYIDCNLDGKAWKGMNVLVISKKIEIVSKGQKLTWNISGKSGEEASKEKNSSQILEINGTDGHSGEGGGHIVFIADDFVSMNCLHFICNGGTGQNGENGRNGKNGVIGKDGGEISMGELKLDFPSPSRSSGYAASCNRTTLLTNIHDKYGGILDREKSKSTDFNMMTGAGLHKSFFRSFYVCGTLSNGVGYQVGFYESTTHRHTYCLLKGGAGEPGIPGESGGIGGQGGLGGKSGSFQAYHLDGSIYGLRGGKSSQGKILVEAHDGEPGIAGENGESGKPGMAGKPGKDVGYLDSKWWSAPVYYGGGKLNLEMTDEGSPESVWCEYHKKWVAVNTEGDEMKEEIAQLLKQRDAPKRQISVTQVAKLRKPEIDKHLAFEEYRDEVMVDDIEKMVEEQHGDWFLQKILKVNLEI